LLYVFLSLSYSCLVYYFILLSYHINFNLKPAQTVDFFSIFVHLVTNKNPASLCSPGMVECGDQNSITSPFFIFSAIVSSFLRRWLTPDFEIAPVDSISPSSFKETS